MSKKPNLTRSVQSPSSPPEPLPIVLFLFPRVTVRFSPEPGKFHLLEIRHAQQSVCIQIKSECSRETVADLAAKIYGLGVAT
jgi:hypothetical protein